jgi:hypothetical protein
VIPARVVGVLGLAALAGALASARRDPLAPLPSVLLWAWERPEDLRFAPQLGVGVAALDRTVTLRGAAIRVEPRRQPLLHQRFPASAYAKKTPYWFR